MSAGFVSIGFRASALILAVVLILHLAALRQDNVKRLLAYSSVAHAGYMLMGFVVLSDEGLTAMLFYTVVYYLMNLGAFMVLLMVLNNSGREDLEGFRGLAWRGGALSAAAMAIFCVALEITSGRDAACNAFFGRTRSLNWFLCFSSCASWNWPFAYKKAKKPKTTINVIRK